MSSDDSIDGLRRQVLSRAEHHAWPPCVFEGRSLANERAWRAGVARGLHAELVALWVQLGELPTPPDTASRA